jgi:endonuclease YncB( thermonuclease family)
MKIYLPALLLLCCTLPVQAEVITKVYDGDTVTTASGEKIRLACIDSPEIANNKHGKADLVNAIISRDWLSSQVLGKEVKIQRILKDLYGRTVARIFLSDKTEVNELSVKTGHSVPYMIKPCPWANIKK